MKENGEFDRSKNWSWTHNNPIMENKYDEEKEEYIIGAEEYWGNLYSS